MILLESPALLTLQFSWWQKKGLDDYGKQKLWEVIDYRKINEKTIPDRYPIPDTSIILKNLWKSKFFTTLYWKLGFNKIILCEEDRQKAAFNFNNGNYEFCRLFFGLENALSIFQRARTLDLPDRHSHFKSINNVFKKFEKAGMKVSVKKSKLFWAEVEFLGFLISEKAIKLCPDNQNDILNYEHTTTLVSKIWERLWCYCQAFDRNNSGSTKA